MDLGLLLIRMFVGGLVAGHGAQKLFGWLGGYGLDGVGAYLEGYGLRPGRLFAALAGAAELVGGLLLVAGLATPVAALLLVSVMLVAVATDHAGKGLWITNGGAEYALTVAAITLGVVLIGPGALSLDRWLGLMLGGTAAGGAALILAVGGAAAVLAFRRTSASARSGEAPAAPGGIDDVAM
jgi:putative oxidoreductase